MRNRLLMGCCLFFTLAGAEVAAQDLSLKNVAAWDGEFAELVGELAAQGYSVEFTQQHDRILDAIYAVAGAPVISESAVDASLAYYFDNERPAGTVVTFVVYRRLHPPEALPVERILVRARRSNEGLGFICELKGRAQSRPACSGNFDLNSGDITFDENSLDLLLPRVFDALPERGRSECVREFYSGERDQLQCAQFRLGSDLVCSFQAWLYSLYKCRQRG